MQHQKVTAAARKMVKNKKILLVGYGRMGSALVNGWTKVSKIINESNITIIEPEDKNISLKDATIVRNYDLLAKNYLPDIILFAVKPQVMPDLLSNYKKFNGSLFISIAAGRSLGFLQRLLGKDKSIIRVMPNLPATTLNGASVMVANSNVQKVQKDDCAALFSAVGNIHWISDETLMDAVTAVSGSGPAYVFYFIESFIDAAIKAGLTEKLATDLVYETISGSLSLAGSGDRKKLEELRINVTSPGGTTEAALKALTSANGLSKLLIQAVKAAEQRAKELNQ